MKFAKLTCFDELIRLMRAVLVVHQSLPDSGILPTLISKVTVKVQNTCTVKDCLFRNFFFYNITAYSFNGMNFQLLSCLHLDLFEIESYNLSHHIMQ